MLPPTPHNIILFELDFNVIFPLLRLLQFLSDLKSTIVTYLHFLSDLGLTNNQLFGFIIQ